MTSSTDSSRRTPTGLHDREPPAIGAPEARSAGEVILDEAERAAALEAGRGPVLELAPGETVVDWILALAAETPDAPALCGPVEALSYRQMVGRAGDLAAALVEAGVLPGQVVAVSLPASVDQVVAILGALLAGAAYLPLDPSQPSARRATLLRDSGAAVLVAAEEAWEPARATGLPCLDPSRVVASGLSPDLRGACRGGEDLAYLLYTSGSTGAPKAVEVTHANLAASTRARDRLYDLRPERFLWLSPAWFDSSVAGLFWTLCAGGALVIPRREGGLDPADLVRLIEAEAVTHLLALPAVHRLLLAEGDASALASLRQVVVAGEVCPGSLVVAHGRALPEAVLWNEYGPTEATVWATAHRCDPARDGERVPIGRPVPGAEVHVLDPGGRPVPVGVVGELHVGGAGVARGYRGRPEETARRFVTAPDGGRLYRTGDLGCRRSDGGLDFRGRADLQVKLRGQRIELEEVEAVLLSLDGVDEAAVDLVDAAGDGAQLVARLVGSVDPDSVLDELSSRLPEAMIPGRVLGVPALPRTASGKLDRPALRALPLPALSGSRAPAGEGELAEPARTLAVLWKELLGLERVGPEAHFFQSGGHSLLAMQLVYRLRADLGVELPLRTLFDSPTFSQQAERIRELQGTSVGDLPGEG